MLVISASGCPSGGGGSGGGGSGTATGTGTAVTSFGTGTAGTQGAGTGDLPPPDMCTLLHGEGWQTTPDGERACAPGLFLCGDACVDLRSDPAHCGTCATSCVGGVECVLGRCGGVFPPPGVGPVRIVSGGDPTTTCFWATEAVPEHSINAAPGEPEYVAAYQMKRPEDPTSDAYYTWSHPDGTFETTLHPAPDPPELDGVADPWATTHGGTRAEYFTYQSNMVGGMSAGGSTPQELQAMGGWTVVPRVLVDGNVDGPSLVADLGAPALYAAWNDQGDPPTVPVGRLQRFAPCTVPDPSAVGCEVSWPSPPIVYSTDAVLVAHVDVAVDPCTRRPVVAARREKEGLETMHEILYRIIALDGSVGPVRLADVILPKALDNCPGALRQRIPNCEAAAADCGPADTCLEINPRPHIATLHRIDPVTESDQCLLLVGYDIYRGETASVRLKVFDITDPALTADEALVEAVDVPKDDPADVDFLGTVVVDPLTGATGVFFYRQEGGDPCTTPFRGYVRRPDEPFHPVVVSPSTFPSTTFDPVTGGLGHYVRGARFNAPGTLFVTWSQPVPTTDPTCATCQGVRYSQPILGAEVVP